MKQVPIKLGPLALLLTVISICLTTLAILVFTTARADMRLAEKYAETVKSRYALETEGQEYLSGLDASALSNAGEDGVARITMEKDGVILHVGLTSGEDDWRIVEWRIEHQWEEDTNLGNLWQGN